MTNISQIEGIFQGDLIIRSALIEGIDDLRRHPEFLDYVFASLKNDSLTNLSYGQKEMDQAKKWFQKTNIAVFMSTRIDKPKFPCVSISLVETGEAENTLADLHYQTEEDEDTEWADLTPRFSPTKYTAATGVMTIPDSVADSIVLAAGMFILDDTGIGHEILDVPDKGTIVLSVNTISNFTHAVIRGAPPTRVITIESCSMKETYQIGCHVSGESFHLTYLHSIVSFILLRYRQALLEARGFERTSIHSADFRRNDYFDIAENVFSRNINLTGFCRQSWPKIISGKISSASTYPIYESTNSNPESPELDLDSLDGSWTVI